MMKSKQFIKKNNFRLIFFVLFGLFISENGFAQKHWIRHYVQIKWKKRGELIVITTTIHNSPYGIINEHGFLEKCIFEASMNGFKYFIFMEIHTPQLDMSYMTTINFKNKFPEASLTFTENVVTPEGGYRMA